MVHEGGEIVRCIIKLPPPKEAWLRIKKMTVGVRKQIVVAELCYGVSYPQAARKQRKAVFGSVAIAARIIRTDFPQREWKQARNVFNEVHLGGE